MANKHRLGRGLSALIPDLSETAQYESAKFAEIEVSGISANPFQPRDNFDSVALNELKDSIKENGIIQPITVRSFEGGFQLISGERRFRAVKQLGYDTIPAYLLDIESDEEMLQLALIENIQRENLNPIDIAKAFDRLIADCNLTQEQVAQKVGKDRSSVTNFLRLLKLPQDIQQSLLENKISMGHARALLAIQDRSDQISLWKKTIKNNYSVRKVEELVKTFSNGGKEIQAKPVPKKSVFIIDMEDQLREIFGTQVLISPKSEGGKIEIQYYSDDDLNRIHGILKQEENPY